MNYRIKLNTQEDENASRGTKYYVEFERLDDWNTSLGETEGETWQEAMWLMLSRLQEMGEI